MNSRLESAAVGALRPILAPARCTRLQHHYRSSCQRDPSSNRSPQVDRSPLAATSNPRPHRKTSATSSSPAADSPAGPSEPLASADELPPPQAPPLPHHSPVTVLQYHVEGKAVDWHVAWPCTTYFLLGTAHVSLSSCEDVTALIRTVQPQVVMVELCGERRALLEGGFHARAPTLAEAVQLVRSGRATPFAIAYAMLLPKVGRQLDVSPGGEFRAAAQAAKEVGAHVVLGDRSIRVTMARMWHGLTAWEKLRLVASLLCMGFRMPEGQELRQEVEQMKETDVLTQAVAAFAKDFPNVMAPLVHERDQYMTAVLRKMAGRVHTVVAVVGAGHLPGIRKWWTEELDVADLMRMPE